MADKPGEFASWAVELLADAGLRQRLATNVRRLVEDVYDWGMLMDANRRQFMPLP